MNSLVSCPFRELDRKWSPWECLSASLAPFQTQSCGAETWKFSSWQGTPRVSDILSGLAC